MKGFRIKAPIVLALLLLNVIVFSQTLPFRNYTAKDGLPGNYVKAIFQDSKGYLWFGTIDGLSHFNGTTFRNFSKKDGLHDSHVTALAEGNDGELWICTLREGIFRFREGIISHYWEYHREEKKTDKRDVHPKINYYLSCVSDPAGRLWIGSNHGLIRLDRQKNTKRFTTADGLNSNMIKDIAVDGNSCVWIATMGGGFSRFKDGVFTNYTTEDGLVHNEVKILLPDSHGGLWIGTSGGLSHFQQNTFSNYTTKDGLCHNIVRALVEDHKGNLWIGTWNGISYFTGKKFVSYTTANGLVDNMIYAISRDKENNTWFATAGGISRLRDSSIISYSQKNGLVGNSVTSILEDKYGRTWIGTSSGLSCYHQNKFTTYTTDDGLAGNAINSLYQDSRGNLWISTTEGISVFSAGKFSNYTTKEGLPYNTIFRVTEGKNGTIWIGHVVGISQFRNGKITEVPFHLKKTSVYCLHEDKAGDLWYGTEAGLHRVKGKTHVCFTTASGLPHNVVGLLYEDSKERLWISTGGGISCYHNGTFTNYTTGEGLPHDLATFFAEDHQGNLWIGTPRGLACFNGKSFKVYTSRNHGLPTDCWETGVSDSQGYIWLGSGEGITRFNPPPVPPNLVPPPIHISRIKVMDEEIKRSHLHELKYNENYIRFEFEGLCYSAPESVHYRYYLDGVDKNWKQTDSPSIFYYLPPGNYSFRVKAVNNEGIESTQPAEMQFIILPAFWQTWWFKGLVILMLLFLMGLLFLWRYRQARAKAELEARTRQLVMAQRMELMGTLASGTVHDLKNLLVVIMTVSQVLSQTLDKKDENFKHIGVLEKTANTAMHMAKQILSFARLKYGEPSGEADLVYLLAEILKTLNLTSPKSVHIKEELPLVPIMFPIQPARFQQLVMNLCLNAVQAMARGGELTVVLSKTDTGVIKLEISDTGPGIEPDVKEKIFDPLFTTKEQEEGTGLGLFVVKQVVEEHKGTIDVVSTPGEGTTFTVSFPTK